ncbi:MAG TPA: OmpA family protein [Treponemataceae bacterium]|nr:OmpA family protein [Treponemataceae bacterium]
MNGKAVQRAYRAHHADHNPHIRPRVSLAAALLIACAALGAEAPQGTAADKVWPGHSIRTASGIEGIVAATRSDGDLTPGYGMRGTLAVEGFFAPALALEASAGYRWIDRADGPLPLPGAALNGGYRFSLPRMFSITPLAGFSLEAACEKSGAKPVTELSCGARFSFLLADNDYLTVTPFASLPLSGGLEPSVSLAVGLRSENPWMLPAPEQRPKVRAKPDLFSPDGDGIDDETKLSLSCADRALVAKWSLTAFDQNGKAFKQWKGTGKPPRAIAWAGDSDGKGAIEPGIEYRLAFETEDALGRQDHGETRATCDILVIKDGDRYKVRVSDIIFPSDSWELSPKESRKLLEANRKTLDRIATLFTRFPDYSLTVEGYANAVFWSDEKKLAEEQKRELLPLSQKRADTVKAALVMLGIDEGRITAKGLGGAKPVAAFADAQSVWKNRRVEFILEKR